MTGRFRNQILRARVSRTPTGGFVLKFTPIHPSPTSMQEFAAEMERRSHDIGAHWAISVEPWGGRIQVDLTRDDSEARAEQFIADLIRDFDLGASAKEQA